MPLLFTIITVIIIIFKDERADCKLSLTPLSGFLFVSFLTPEDGGDMVLRNVGLPLKHTVRTLHSH